MTNSFYTQLNKIPLYDKSYFIALHNFCIGTFFIFFRLMLLLMTVMESVKFIYVKTVSKISIQRVKYRHFTVEIPTADLVTMLNFKL